MQGLALLETSCGYLLQELQMIWEEVGEDQFEREKVLLDLEQECLAVYRRKVDSANTSRAHLHQELADSEAEFTHLLLSLGERSLPGRPVKMTGALKEQLGSITPALREMRLRKEERLKQFHLVQQQIKEISAEIAGRSEYDDSSSNFIVNEKDLSLKKLEEYHIELQRLHNEKTDRLQRVENYITSLHSLSATLGMDSSSVITKVHPSLKELCGISKNISDGILEKLNDTKQSLEDEKQKRLEKLHILGKKLTNLWNLMGTPYEDRQSFSHIVTLLLVPTAEISNPGSLTNDIIQQVEAEVKRLDQLKASKMKELLHRKQIELEEIRNRSHMEIPSQSGMDNLMNLINSGEIDYADLLKSIDEQITRANEEAFSRKAIMEKVEKWISARDEERWLEEYSRDDNRYSVSRGAHRNLRRAERARITVKKIPALVDLLTAITKSWEEERKKAFLYDEVPLLELLEEYKLSRQETEEEKQRQREKKKKKVQVQVQLGQVRAEHGNLPGSSRPTSSSSSCRVPTRSLNGSVCSATPLISKRLSIPMGTQRQWSSPNSSYSATQGVSSLKQGNQTRPQKMYAQPSPVSRPPSVVSSFSGPLSP